MSESNIEEEVKAIKTVTGALSPLKHDARKRVVAYVLEHLGIDFTDAQKSEPLSSAHKEAPGGRPAAPAPERRILDIRSLREQKKPTTDMQMAAIVAYYVSRVAPEDDQKDCITADDISKYFEQAGHRIPPDARNTLNNAKNAGYLDRVEPGQFRLNPVGHNLVVHSLPKSPDTLLAPGKRQRRGRGNAAGKRPKKAAKKAGVKKKRKARG